MKDLKKPTGEGAGATCAWEDFKTTQPGAAVPHVHGRGRCSFGKLQRILASAFLSTREIEHGQFRALFAGMFCSKIQNGWSLLKSSSN
jgi:hypothetical protein